MNDQSRPQYPEYPGEIPAPPPPPQGQPSAPGYGQPAAPSCGQQPPPPAYGQPVPEGYPQPGEPYPPVTQEAAPYGQPVPPPSSWVRPQSLKGLGVASAILAAVYAVLAIGAAIASWPAREKWLEEASFGREPYDATTAWDIVMVVSLLVLLAIYIVTCLWMYRARTNSELLSPTIRHSLPRGWVWGGWVCPVVNLWFPVQMMQNILRAATPGRSHAGLLTCWWTAWIVAGIAAMVQLSFTPTEGINELTDSHRAASVVAAVLASIACVLWIAVIRRVTTALQPQGL